MFISIRHPVNNLLRSPVVSIISTLLSVSVSHISRLTADGFSHRSEPRHPRQNADLMKSAVLRPPETPAPSTSRLPNPRSAVLDSRMPVSRLLAHPSHSCPPPCDVQFRTLPAAHFSLYQQISYRRPALALCSILHCQLFVARPSTSQSKHGANRPGKPARP